MSCYIYVYIKNRRFCFQVCQNAWETLYAVSHNSTLQMVREVKAGDHGEHKRVKKATVKLTKEAFVESWLDEFFTSVADIMPDANGRETQHLPEWMTYKWIHEKMLSARSTKIEGMECQVLNIIMCTLSSIISNRRYVLISSLQFQTPIQGGISGEQGQFCCLSTLTKVWSRRFPHVIIPKNHRFSQCTTCAKLNSDLKAKINFLPTCDTDEKKLELYREKVQIYILLLFMLFVNQLLLYFYTHYIVFCRYRK